MLWGQIFSGELRATQHNVSCTLSMPLIICVWKAKWAKCISYLCAYSFSWLMVFSGWFMATAHANCNTLLADRYHMMWVCPDIIGDLFTCVSYFPSKNDTNTNPKVHRTPNWPIERLDEWQWLLMLNDTVGCIRPCARRRRQRHTEIFIIQICWLFGCCWPENINN